ncbi:MAG: bifunctional [glutamate--ammonia ligase]-adenylyl-L-tyrosine phosphorylase/[glutamate--ammonia-ligase] adenylyltransferase, partial [Deltaproteobacteria bacterium]
MSAGDAGIEPWLERSASLWPGRVGAREVDALWRAAPHPERALATLVRAAEARRPTAGWPVWEALPWCRVVVDLAGVSRAFARTLVAHPRLVELLAAAPSMPPPGALSTALLRAARAIEPTAVDAPKRLGRLLRRVRRREILRLALAEIRGTPQVEVMAQLSELAALSFEAALSVLWRRLVAWYGRPPATRRGGTSPGFVVLGMGKLGGHELNPSSDVDVLYVYESDGPTSGGSRGRVEAFEFHAKLAEHLGRVLGESTEHGFVFRVDLDLRPEGRSGPIVNSVRALESYYESYGRTWERQALIRARPIAGDLELGEQVLTALAPFVWRRSLDLDALREIAALHDRIVQEAAR